MLKTNITKVVVLFSAVLLFTALAVGCGKKDAASSGSLASETKSSTSSASSGAVSVEIPPMSTNGIMYGVIIDATGKSMTVQSDMGTTVRFALNKEVDIADVKEGISTGVAVKIEYTGSLDGNSSGKAKITKVSDSEKLPKLSKEALAAAGAIILAVRDRDQSTLARLCEYPLVFDTGKEKEVANVQAFISLKRSAIFTKRLVSSVSRTNLFVTNAYSDGFLLGLSKPNIVVSSTKDGYFITGFHYK